jgi:hypothetical protein
MFGLKFIRSKELKRLQQLDNSYRGIISDKDEEIAFLKGTVNSLSSKLAKFDRPRVSGKFAKITKNLAQ